MRTPDFYIEKLIVSGSNTKPAVVDFSKGLNLITGASNTGKSLIVDCLDYAFGYTKKGKNHHYRMDTLKGYGYDTVKIILRTKYGTAVEIKRDIGKNKVIVDGSDYPFSDYNGQHHVNSGDISLNDVLLRMIGIDKKHKILSSVNGETQRITWRGIQHLFFVHQANIMEENSIYINPDAKTVSQISSPAALLFLLNGTNADEIPSKEELMIINERDNAVVDYLRQYKNYIVEKRENVAAKSLTYQVVGDTTISKYETDIQDLQEKINVAVNNSKKIMGEIYECNNELSKYEVLRNYFSVLKNRYGSDARRMAFIAEGESTISRFASTKKCPFCDNELDTFDNQTISDIIRINAEHILTHVKDLDEADKDVSQKQIFTRTRLEELERFKENTDAYINNELKPRLEKLQQTLSEYKSLVQMQTEINLLENEEKELSSQIQDIQATKEERNKPKTYHIADQYSSKVTIPLEYHIRSILKYVGFPLYDTARLDLDTFDLKFGLLTKSGYMGGGYSGILNSIMILGLMQDLINNGKYTPGFSVIDSPLSMLSEAENKEKDTQLKHKLLQYLYETRGSGQVIIVEQKEKISTDLKEWESLSMTDENLNVLQFSGVSGYGRYGFLPDVTNEHE